MLETDTRLTPVFRSFNPSNGIGVVHAVLKCDAWKMDIPFQSLKRDRGGSCYKRMEQVKNVLGFQSLKRDRGGSCQVRPNEGDCNDEFQSLKRDRGGSCAEADQPPTPEGEVSIPQTG